MNFGFINCLVGDTHVIDISSCESIWGMVNRKGNSAIKAGIPTVQVMERGVSALILTIISLHYHQVMNHLIYPLTQFINTSFPLMRAGFFEAMNFTVLITLCRVSSSNCSAGSPKTDAKMGMSCCVRPTMVGFSCSSTQLAFEP